MDRVLELEKKVAYLEKRIVFLYNMIDKQSEINDRLIKQYGELQGKVFEYANQINRNTMLLNVIGNFIKSEEES